MSVGGREPGARAEWAVALLAVVGLAGVFLPVLLAPGEVLYGPRSDLLAFVHPYRVIQSQAIARNGRPTLWDPTQFGGRPLTGDPQAALYYPPSWLPLLDVGGEGEGLYGIDVLLHLVVGALGMLFWLRDGRLSAASRLAAAAIFVLGAKWSHHLFAQGHLVFLPLMWLPWQLVLVDRLIDRPTRGAAAGLAFVTGAVLLGLHTQLAFYGQLLVLAYALMRLAGSAPTHRGRGLGWLMLAGAAAIGLSAVGWAPLLADLPFYVRGEGLDAASASVGATTPGQLLDAITTGTPSRAHEPPLHPGVVAPALAVMALFASSGRRRIVFCAVALGFMVLYSLGPSGGLFSLLFHAVPGFDLFRLPTRVLLLTGLPLGVLVAAGIDVVARGDPKRSMRGASLVLAAIGLVLFAIRPDGERALGLAWTLPALLLWPPWPASWRARSAWLLAALVLADVARVAVPMIETKPLDEALGSNPLVEKLRAPLGEGRVLAYDLRSRGDMSALPATYTTRAGIESLRGFSPLIPEPTWTFLLRGAGGLDPEQRPSVTIPSFVIRSRPHLDLFNVRWVATGARLNVDGLALREEIGPIDVYHYQTWKPFTTIAATRLYENTRRMPRAALVREARQVADRDAAIAAVGELDPRHTVLVEAPTASSVRPGADEDVPVDHRFDEIHVDVDAGEGGYLVLSELWHPGWRAEVDGESAPIVRANGIFQAVDLTPGHHRVRLRFRPRSWQIGRVVSGMTGLTLLVGLAWGGLGTAQRREDSDSITP